MNTFPIIPCICVFFIITFSIEIAWAVQMNKDYIVLTPKRLFSNIKTLNKFGAITITVLFRVLNPVGTIGKTIHFLFTNGRARNEVWK